MIRTVAIVLVGIGNLVALALVATVLAASLGSSPSAGYALAHALEVATLLMTLALIILAWGRFIERTRRRSV